MTTTPEKVPVPKALAHAVVNGDTKTAEALIQQDEHERHQEWCAKKSPQEIAALNKTWGRWMKTTIVDDDRREPSLGREGYTFW